MTTLALQLDQLNKQKKERVPRECRIVKGNSFRKAINLYWIKRNKERKNYYAQLDKQRSKV